MSGKTYFRAVAQGLPGVATFLALWEVIPRLGVLNPEYLPPFSRVAAALYEMLIDGTLLKHVTISLERSLGGFGLAAAIAVPTGCLLGWYPRMEEFLDPLLQLFRQTSVLALFPVFILVFGLGEFSKVFLIFWAVQWPILLNTILGVREVDPLLIKTARSMDLSRWQLLTKVVLPAAFPTIFLGIRLAATYSILVLVAAEMIGAKSGLGFLLFESEQLFKVPTMFASIVTMALLGLGLNYGLVALGDRINSWKGVVDG
ncbi:MAG: ABC transporter permease [Polyangiaceae bacterium]|jgi:NitT/TauT family transport system permease protein